MASLEKSKYQGIFLNRTGKVIHKNSVSNNQMKNRRGGKDKLNIEEAKSKLMGNKVENTNELVTVASLPSVSEQHIEPSWIDVYMSGKYSANTLEHGCKYCVKDVDFYYYQTYVLPNEWEITWHQNSLQAGALCVKMYAWYAVKDPLHDDLNADIRDDTYDQVYIAGSDKSSTNSAISAVGGIGLHRKVDQYLFLTQYRAGTPGVIGAQSSGMVEQEGTQVLATNGKYVYEILGHYYNGSSKVGGYGKIFEFFVY
ncbi:SpoIID/LytB domain-containing protein [Peribacillus acanthi]|uniref:SpoIID/LytB domain-containing protein n=1 Tax=Peribacillus acanthi TaxID=2171554 RepID=UPI000D3EBCA6|nr:SpoIID/LytB domain-containing protein [Peribacillus acanthi]